MKLGLFLLILLFPATEGMAFTLNFNCRATGTASGSVKVSATFMGSVPPITCPPVGSFTMGVSSGEQYSLTAVPGSGTSFAGWKVISGSASNSTCTGARSPCTFTISGDFGIDAVFTPIYTEAIGCRGTGGGTMTFKTASMANPSSITCPPSPHNFGASAVGSTQFTLTAQAASGSHFVGWTIVSGSALNSTCTGTTTPCAFTVSGDFGIFAVFNNISVKVTKSTGRGGSITSNIGLSCLVGATICSTSVSSGTSVTLTANPAAGFDFDGWQSGTGSASVCNGSKSTTCSFTANTDSTITANFHLS